jgi:membrane protease YdiL (CAAX protease family)
MRSLASGGSAVPSRKGSVAVPALVLCLGAIVIGLAGYWRAIPAEARPVLRACLALLWLSLAWLAGRSAALGAYRSVLLAFFGVSFGIWLASLVGGLPLRWLNLTADSLPGLVAGKLSEVTPIIAAILLVNRLEGGDLGRLLLRRGRLGLSLGLGLAVGALCLVIFLAMGGWEAVSFAGPARLLAALPLILVFVLANSLMEELWFRGAILTRCETVLGPGAALIVTAVAFSALHASAYYTEGLKLVQYTATTLLTGLAWGWIAQRTRTLWGSVLSHAIGDVFVVLGFFFTLL